MQPTKLRRAVIAIVLLSVMATGGCGGLRGKVKQDPTRPPSLVLDNIAVQLDQAIDGAKALRKVKEVLLANGKITKEKSHQMTLALIKIDTSISIAAKKTKTYDTFTLSARDTIFQIFQDIESGYRELRAAGLVSGSADVDRALLIFDAALEALRILLRPTTQAEIQQLEFRLMQELKGAA